MKPIRRTATTRKHENPNQLDLGGHYGHLDLVEGAGKAQDKALSLIVIVRNLDLLTLAHWFADRHIDVSLQIMDSKRLPDYHLLRVHIDIRKNVFVARRDEIVRALRSIHVNIGW